MSTESVLDRNGHLTELARERLAAEQASRIPDEDRAFMALARQHHDTCTPCRDAVAELAPIALPALPLPAPRPRSRLPIYASAFALAATAAIVALTLPRTPDTRLKGGTFDFEVQASDGRVLSDGSEVHPGDPIYFAARVSEPSYVAIWGVDAHDQRYTIREAARLEPASEAARLPEGIEPDADGDRETIVARACPASFTIDSPVAVECVTRSLTLRKVRGR